MIRDFQTQLLEWYAQNARRLPWRGDPDAYTVWVSEIMLQQTRVETALPYFERWMSLFPTVQALASASQQEVLAAWEGLGYYSRARNLHRAAQMVMEQYGGELPGDMQALRQLPGIGRYTAAAITSLAFHQDEATLDGNIRRVISRVFDVALPARSPAGENLLWSLAAKHLPAGKAAEYNQALMDLGATICKPRQPECRRCPLSRLCAANRLGIQNQRPVLPPRREVPHHIVTAAVIRRDGQVLIAQRPPEKLLGGLWEFPGGKIDPGETLDAGLKRELREELGVEVSVREALGMYRHAYTHFRVSVHAFCCTLEAGEPRNLEHTALKWAKPAQLADYPMGKVDRQIAARVSDACLS